MIRILLIGFAGLFAIWLFIRLMTANLFGRGKSRGDFGHAVRSLLLLMENGGVLRVRHRESGMQLDMIRIAGTNDDADLKLVIPRAEWARNSEETLRQLFAMQELDATVSPPGADDVLAEIRIHQPEIWDDASGAKGARVMQLVVDAISLPREARFDVAFIGRRSNRIAKKHMKRTAEV